MSHTLYNTEDTCAKNGGKPPLSYKAFEKAMAALGPPAAPAPDAPEKLPPVAEGAKGAGEEETAVPSLAELGYPPKATTSIKVAFPLINGPSQRMLSMHCIHFRIVPTAVVRQWPAGLHIRELWGGACVKGALSAT